MLLLPLLSDKRKAKKCTNKNTSGQMSCSLAASFPILSRVVKNFNRSSSVIIYITRRQHVLSIRTEITVVKQTHTQPSYGPFQELPGWAGARRNLLHFVVQGKITEADTLTTQLGATPSGRISAHLHHPPIFMPDALPAITLPLYPGLGQASNVLACIPCGVVYGSKTDI